ncbi:MAG: hypothetical protein Fur0020_03920 [Thermodesulfovibrionia bacterium]
MNKIITILTISLIPFILSTPAFSGEFPIISDSTVIGQNYGYPSGTNGLTEVNSLDLIVETTFFLKNLEIVDLPIDGETFIGYLAPLRLRYRAHEKVTLEAGAILGHNFGDDEDIDEVEPLLRIAYEPIRDVFVIAGTIIRTHPMHDALYDDVNAFKEIAEQGFQIRSDKGWLKEDMWINWRVRETSIRAERFVFANSTQMRYNGIYLDGQLYWAHTGGQKNTDDRLENNVTLLAGGSYGVSPQSLKDLINLKEIRIGGYYLYNHDYSRNVKESDGDGFEGRITADIMPAKNTVISIFGSYFKGDEILARDGDPLYSMDEYAQLGTNILFNLPAGLRIEFGMVGQFVKDKFVHTEQLYLTWGKAFNLLRNI